MRGNLEAYLLIGNQGFYVAVILKSSWMILE